MMKRIVFWNNHGVTTTIESIKLEEERYVPIERIEKNSSKTQSLLLTSYFPSQDEDSQYQEYCG